MNNLLGRLNRLGSELNLTFSAQEFLKHGAMGLDSSNRKLLVITNDAAAAPSFVLIDLDDISNSVVVKQYGSIHGGDLKRKPLEQYLKSIVLLLEQRQGKPPVEIPFYNDLQNSVDEIRELEERASHWELMISKLEVRSRQRA